MILKESPVYPIDYIGGGSIGGQKYQSQISLPNGIVARVIE